MMMLGLQGGLVPLHVATPLIVGCWFCWSIVNLQRTPPMICWMHFSCFLFLFEVMFPVSAITVILPCCNSCKQRWWRKRGLMIKEESQIVDVFDIIDDWKEEEGGGAGYYLVGRERERGRYIDGRPLITSWEWLIKVMNIDDTGRNQYSLWQEKFLGGEKTGLSVSQPLSLSLSHHSLAYILVYQR